jgi:hypothetical protein
MKTLSIVDVEATRKAQHSQLSATLRLGRSRRRIYFRTKHVPVAVSADPFVPAVLLPAMERGLDVNVEAPVSRDVLDAANRVQAVEAAWNRPWKMIALTAAADDQRTDQRADSARSVGAFFSGGVDSFCTLQKHREEITHAVFVTGFDIPVGRTDAKQLVLRQLRKVARAIDMELVEVETNLREFSNGLDFSWEAQHGAALAAVAHFLAPGIGKIYVPSSNALPFLFPYGSHPGLDPLWTSKHVEIVHDGIEASRFDKIAAVSSWDLGLRNLRVCWQVVEGEYNCCRCRKCLWTMAFLRACGVLEQATSFPLELDLRALSQQSADNSEQRYRMIQAMSMLDELGRDQPLVDALQQALQRAPKHNAAWQRAFRRSLTFL